MRRFLPILFAGLLGGGLPALAEDPVPVFSDTVVVSAALDAEEREEVPASVTVIDQQEIEARQALDLPELLTTVPGVLAVRAGSPGQQTSIFTRGAESDQTLLLWNGIPLNDPYFGAINWQFVPLDGVERVEVVRGPFSALYGSNAVGGVVQVFSGSRRGGTLHLEGGENGYRRGGLVAGTDLGPVRLDAAGNVRRGDGELANDFFDAEEATVRTLWTLAPGVSLGVLGRANDSDTGIPLSGGQPTLHRQISWQEREVAIPFRVERGSWEIESQLSQTRFDSRFRDPDDPFGAIDSRTESEARRGRAVTTWSGGRDLWIAFGGDWERLEATNRSGSLTQLDAARQRTWAAFGQASYGHGPVRIDLGLRRDDNDVFGAETSLRTGAIFTLAKGTLLRASYGEAFRAPSLGDLFFPFFGNPDLQPERSKSWELGLEREAGDWRFAVTGFESRQRNLIDFEPTTFVSINVGRARMRGVEGEVGFRHGIYSARLNGTYLDAEDLDAGTPLRRRPKHSASLLLTARPGDWILNLESRYVGDRPDFDEVTFATRDNPSYTRVDLAARWKALDWLSPYARIENAADEQYEEVLRYPTPGRTLIGGVAIDF
ncbi:MAG TPA: TonB-dependent receptor [Thermoanaerobaculia bacterium]|jgi:vitamin B12 transporter|nr:TonB-dependent receptor [Thermoanaerobaculia bacterium]